MFCINCGQALDSDANYCPKCGTPQKTDVNASRPATVGSNETMGDLLTLIKSLRLEKRYTDTLAACDRALRIEPTSAEVWRTKGDVLSLIGDYSKALDAYNHVLAQHPMDISVLHSKISVLNRLGRGQEASELNAQLIRHQASIDLDWANQQLSKVPNDGEAWRKKALALLTLQRYQEALMRCTMFRWIQIIGQ